MIIRAVAAMLTMAVLAMPAAADFTILSWTFDGDEAGRVPSGFAPGETNRESGRWEVVAGAKPLSPPNVLARIPAAQPSEGAQVLFIENAKAGNLDLTVRIKPESAEAGAGSGVIFRAQDERNYYLLWLSPAESLIRLDKVVNGVQTPIQDLQVEIKPGIWHALRLQVHGPTMEAFFDSPQFLSAREDSWEHASYKQGKLGLWARGPGVTYFDNVRFSAADGGTGSGPLGGTETTIIK